MVPTPSRHCFWTSSDRIAALLKDAIRDRRLAAAAASDFERKFHRANMRFAAREAVAECRKWLAREFS